MIGGKTRADGKEGEGAAASLSLLLMPNPARASVPGLVCAHLQGGAIFSSCTPSPAPGAEQATLALGSNLEAWSGRGKGETNSPLGEKSQKRGSLTEETLHEIMFP